MTFWPGEGKCQLRCQELHRHISCLPRCCLCILSIPEKGLLMTGAAEGQSRDFCSKRCHAS